MELSFWQIFFIFFIYQLYEIGDKIRNFIPGQMIKFNLISHCIRIRICLAQRHAMPVENAS